MYPCVVGNHEKLVISVGDEIKYSMLCGSSRGYYGRREMVCRRRQSTKPNVETFHKILVFSHLLRTDEEFVII